MSNLPNQQGVQQAEVTIYQSFFLSEMSQLPLSLSLFYSLSDRTPK